MEVSRLVVYQVDARVLLREESRRERRPVLLDSIPPLTLDSIAGAGFGWLSLSGIWETAGREPLLRSANLLEALQEALPDLTFEDIDSSPFAVRRYRARTDLGGDDALEGLRADLARRDIRLMLDFVSDQVALDHPWGGEHPEFFVQGKKEDLSNEPYHYHRTRSGVVLAHARGQNRSPIPDALQLDYRHAGLRSAMLRELESVASRSDGIRVLGADRVLPEVMGKLWEGLPADGSPSVDRSFWLEAISRVRSRHPLIVFMAQIDSFEGTHLWDQGFDYLSSGALREALLLAEASAVRERLEADHGSRGEVAHFLESHFTARAAVAFPPEVHPAAAIITYLPPGMALFHDGQTEGRRVRQYLHLVRRAEEAPDREIASFYERLREILERPEASRGRWSLLSAREAWPGNSTWKQFVPFVQRRTQGGLLLSVVNYGPLSGQCYVDLNPLDTAGGRWAFQDLFSLAIYERDGDELASKGLYLDLGPWDYNVFEMARKTR